MKTLEILLSRRWILKSREKELYFRIKDELGTVKKFLTEKLGYQVIVNPYLIKVEKMPASPENWMGITDFSEKLEYVFLCLILMFLEDKEAEEQFVLSELTEYVQSVYKEEQIDWTVYSCRRQLIKVIRFCIREGILEINDGTEESFTQEGAGEVLYENTGVSRYFMKNFTQDIMGYQSPADFQGEEWIGVKEDRGIVRRQRVYRRLLLSMGMYRKGDTDEDFAYVKNYRNMIHGELSELFECELQVHRSSAFLILGETCGLGRCFPEENTLSDIVLLCNSLFAEKIAKNEIEASADESIRIPEEKYRRIVEECKARFGRGWIKTYREMTTGEFYRAVKNYMEQMELIEVQNGDILLRTAISKIIGKYPDDFKTGEADEQ